MSGKVLPAVTTFGYLHSELGISRLYANFQKLQLIGIVLVVSMATAVMDQPVGVVWRRAEDDQKRM